MVVYCSTFFEESEYKKRHQSVLIPRTKVGGPKATVSTCVQRCLGRDGHNFNKRGHDDGENWSRRLDPALLRVLWKVDKSMEVISNSFWPKVVSKLHEVRLWLQAQELHLPSLPPHPNIPYARSCSYSCSWSLRIGSLLPSSRDLQVHWLGPKLTAAAGEWGLLCSSDGLG